MKSSFKMRLMVWMCAAILGPVSALKQLNVYVTVNTAELVVKCNEDQKSVTVTNRTVHWSHKQSDKAFHAGFNLINGHWIL